MKFHAKADDFQVETAVVDVGGREIERDGQSGGAVLKAVEAASLTIFCCTADCERLHLRVEIHLYITRQWALGCLQSNTD